jgi:short-subunit dehydrogenase
MDCNVVMAGQRRTALITGASAGIGEAFAEVFASEGFDLILVARREDRLRALAVKLTERHGVTVHAIVSDLSRRQAVQEIADELAGRALTVDVLVNNAGYGVPGSFTASPWSRHQAMLQVMLAGVAELTHALLPAMVERRYGRIINVASLAGLVPSTAGHTLYGATKAFLIKFSQSLSAEVARYGVNVTAVCPGFTHSEFHDVTGTRDKVNQMPRWMWMDAPSVARQGFDAVMIGTPIYVNGRVNRTIATLVRLLPQRLVNSVARGTGSRYRNAGEGSDAGT